MSSHKIEYVKYIKISYTIPLYSSKGNFIADVTDSKEFKTAHHAARWYAQKWSNKRWAHLPYNPDDGKQAVVERRVKKIFKQYLP